jgi:hypothetical protein
MERGYENIDYSKFRPDIDLEKTKNLLSLAILGLIEQQRAKIVWALRQAIKSALSARKMAGPTASGWML